MAMVLVEICCHELNCELAVNTSVHYRHSTVFAATATLALVLSI